MTQIISNHSAAELISLSESEGRTIQYLETVEQADPWQEMT